MLSQNILKYDWTSAELDFAYPLEVSSSLYLLDVIAPILMACRSETQTNLRLKLQHEVLDLKTVS